MQIYLPIAEISLNLWLLLGLGLGVGFLSGLFGVGGGFLMTPLLFFCREKAALPQEQVRIWIVSRNGLTINFRSRLWLRCLDWIGAGMIVI